MHFDANWNPSNASTTVEIREIHVILEVSIIRCRVSSCLRDAKRGLTLQIAMSSCVIWTLQIVAILIGIFWADDGVIRTDGALLRMPWFCQIIIIAAPLAAHVILGGIFRRSDGYKVYQPFRGGEIHILLQSFGWLFFSAVTLFVAQSVIQERREGYWLVRIFTH